MLRLDDDDVVTSEFDASGEALSRLERPVIRLWDDVYEP